MSRLSQLIADDFLEFGSSGGTYTKQDVLDASDRLPHVLTPLVEFEVRFLSADAALVTYRSTTCHDDGSRSESLRSSLWVLRDGRWQIRFHQGTQAEKSSRQSASD